MIFPFPYFEKKTFLPLTYLVVGMSLPIAPYLMVEFSFDILERFVLSVLFGPVSGFLSSFFHHYFLISLLKL